jgi:hypothetical protein
VGPGRGDWGRGPGRGGLKWWGPRVGPRGGGWSRGLGCGGSLGWGPRAGPRVGPKGGVRGFGPYLYSSAKHKLT